MKLSLMKRQINAATVFGLAFGLAAIAVILLTLFGGGVIGGVDYGEYDKTLYDLGLKRTEDDLNNPNARYYVDVNDNIDYDTLSFQSPLKLGSSSIVFPVTVIRFLTKYLKIGFYTEALAVLYALILAFSVFLMSVTLYRRYGAFASIPCVLGLVVLSVPDLTGYFNSLHWQGSALIWLYGYICVFIWAAFSPLRGRLLRFVLLCIYGKFLISAHASMLVFLPLIFLSCLWILLRDRPNNRLRYFIIGGFLLLWSLISSINAVVASPDYSSAMSKYQAVFNGSVQYAEDPITALSFYGLDNSYLPDLGHSYYEQSEEFIHDPKNDDEWALLGNKLNVWKTLAYYTKYPKSMINLLKESSLSLHNISNGRIAVKGTGSRQTITNLISLIGGLMPIIGLPVFLIITGIFLVTTIILILFSKHKRRLYPLIFSALALVLTSAYIPWTVVLGGAPLIAITKPVYGAAAFLLSISMLVFLIRVIVLLAAWSNDETKKAVSNPPIYLPKRELTYTNKIVDYIAKDSRHLNILTLLLSIFIMSVLLFVKPHAGGINNGDYGRMMDQLDLIWTDEMVDNHEEQAGRYIIEEYNYKTDFNILKLTALDPSYSLIYPSALVRLYSGITGNSYNTRIVQYIYSILTILLILITINDLYQAIGKYTLVPAILLPLMFLGENYIAWYNSLYGESSINIGLLMIIAASTHLAICERGKKPIGWLILLAFSINYLVCSKAQMLLALPAGFGLTIFFFCLHYDKSKKVIYKIAYILLGVTLLGYVTLKGVTVFLNNDEVSAKQTVWQSVFFGALMVSDDVDKAMEELNIPLEMKPDIGKHAYYNDEDYVYAPMSEEAEVAFYNHVNTFTMVRYYTHHLKDFLYMLNHAASQAKQLHTGFMAYEGQRYDLEHDKVGRFAIWSNIRVYLAPNNFWQYVLLYGIVTCFICYLLLNKKLSMKIKALIVIWLAVIIIGVLQFPLTVIGNGFADNNKQLYAFMLCHDLTIVSLFTVVLMLIIHIKQEKRFCNPDGIIKEV